MKNIVFYPRKGKKVVRKTLVSTYQSAIRVFALARFWLGVVVTILIGIASLLTLVALGCVTIGTLLVVRGWSCVTRAVLHTPCNSQYVSYRKKK